MIISKNTQLGLMMDDLDVQVEFLKILMDDLDHRISIIDNIQKISRKVDEETIELEASEAENFLLLKDKRQIDERVTLKIGDDAKTGTLVDNRNSKLYLIYL